MTARDRVGGVAAAPVGTGGRLVRTVTIVNSRGLHARAAARFVKAAARFAAEITVTRNDMTVSGLSIMGLMMLAAGPGSEIEIAAEGVDAEAALDTLEALVADKFGED